MSTLTTRRRFIEITPFAGLALLAACSPKTESSPPVAASVPPPAPAPAPPPAVPAAEVAPVPAPATVATNLPMVDEKDAQAIALGYVTDATRADKVKFKTWVAGSQCSGCALYLGKAGDASGGCPLFPAKNVAAAGWCGSWVKKA